MRSTRRMFSAGLWPALLMLVATLPPARAARSTAILLDPDETFARAARAYDEGDYPQALELYGQMLEAGYGGKALHFNTGNTLFRMGKTGHAVAHYRRAWREAPRDADIQTNLAYAQRQAGSIPSQLSLLEALWSHFSPGEWALFATAAWWAGAGLLAVSFHDRRHRIGLRKAAALCGVLLLLSAPGVQYWRGPSSAREAVVVEAGHQAKFAPLEGAQAHFEVPHGTIVRVREEAQGWYRVTLNEKSGWLPAGACSMVLAEAYEWLRPRTSNTINGACSRRELTGDFSG